MSAKRAAPGAIKDPFYLKILAGLGGHLDPETFEAAVCDLLRDAPLSLVPIPGGSDRGMDGAIADGKGEAFPLVCTTSPDVIGNLTASLDAYLAGGGRRRNVVLATSQALTARRRANLEKRATDKGFTLIQVFEQRTLADRLYRSSRWLKELLGLIGEPSALSVVPLTRRPRADIPLIGREKELDWLRTSSGDRLIVGQPGSGKTFLLSQLVRERGWLFLVSDDETAIAVALRDQQPAVVIVDDAHTDPSRLDRLRHLRQEQGAPFEIVATTWPGEQDAVLSALGTPTESQVVKLELMPRRDIKALLESLDIRERETGQELVRELIEQSANKPGLAVTLGSVWLRGEWRSLVEGRAIDRALLPLFEERVGKEVRGFLASFAIGGSRGMSLDAVAAFHALSQPEAWQKAASLAAGGVLSNEGPKTLAVVPRMLRVALLRTVFFPEEGPLLSVDPLLEKAHPGAAAEVLAEAAIRGAPVPRDLLRRALLRADPRQEIVQIAPRAWSLAALLSTTDAEWVLDHYPGNLIDVAWSALERAPEIVIARLLQAAETAEGRIHPTQSRPLRLLSDWVEDLDVRSSDEPLRRRRLLARTARTYLEAGGERAVGVEALFLALSPKARGCRSDAMGSAVIRYTSAPLSTLTAMEDLWKEVKGSLPPLDAQIWSGLRSLLWNWIHPHLAAAFGQVRPDAEKSMKDFARRVLTDLAAHADGKPGVGTGLTELAAHLGAQLPIAVDPTFTLLYPASADGGEEEIARREMALTALSERWMLEPPEVVAARLATYEAEAGIVGHQGWPRRPVDVARRIAAATADPVSWLDAFLKGELTGDLVQPFLAEIVRNRQEGWDRLALLCLQTAATGPWTFELLLREPDLPPDLLAEALRRAPGAASSVATLALRRELPLPTLSALLRHPDWEVAAAAAVGEWNSEPRGGIRPELLDAWRSAILRAQKAGAEGAVVVVSVSYWLAEILAGDPELSLEWWIARIREGRLPSLLSRDDSLRASVRCLNLEQRQRLLGELEPQLGLDALLPLLVDRQSSLFARLLGLFTLKEHHLAALQGKPDPVWADLASLAIRHGYTADQVASAAFIGMLPFTSGSGLDYWMEWDQAFEALESDSRPEVREVAAEGRKIALADIERSHEKQRQFELHGW